MKTIVEIHALQSFAPSNLNRDDTGAPKDAIFGGTRRARVSSQCWKREIRRFFSQMARDGGLSPDDIATRTKRLQDALVGRLAEEGHGGEQAVQKARQALAGVGLAIKDDGKSEYLLFLGRREIDRIAALIHERWDSIIVAGPEDGKATRKSSKKVGKKADPELSKAMAKVFDGGKAVDVALFGRMLADMPEKSQDAACQVAHAISTHSVEREFDFYTAVDDLKPEDTTGADMMGTVEFNSACFYRYAVVDWEKLLENLQGDEGLAEKGLCAFLKGFIIAEPTGKQNSFAAHNPPEFVALSVRHDTAPRNLANAFETPVWCGLGESMTKKSAEALVDKAKILDKYYGAGAGRTMVMNLLGVSIEGFGTESDSLEDLVNEALEAVRE